MIESFDNLSEQEQEQEKPDIKDFLNMVIIRLLRIDLERSKIEMTYQLGLLTQEIREYLDTKCKTCLKKESPDPYLYKNLKTITDQAPQSYG